jgi:hypothetical protein
VLCASITLGGIGRSHRVYNHPNGVTEEEVMTNLLISILGTTVVTTLYGLVVIGFLKLVQKYGLSEEEIWRVEKEKEVEASFKKD